MKQNAHTTHVYRMVEVTVRVDADAYGGRLPSWCNIESIAGAAISYARGLDPNPKNDRGKTA